LLRSAPYWRTILSGDPAPEPKKALIDRFLRIAPAYYVAFAVTIVTVFLVQ
jgi:peptidoglycan/LPS O-acetylase OafA/YrhL